MKTNNMSMDAILTAVRRTLIERADEDRAFARDVRGEAFDASITKQIEAGEYRKAAAVNEFEIANVEGMAGLVPLGLGQGPAWLITMGKEKRHGYVADVPLVGGALSGVMAWTEDKLGQVGDKLLGPKSSISETLEHADKGAKLDNDALATDAGIAAKRHDERASRAKELLSESRDAMKQAFADARALEDERREAVRLTSEI